MPESYGVILLPNCVFLSFLFLCYGSIGLIYCGYPFALLRSVLFGPTSHFYQLRKNINFYKNYNKSMNLFFGISQIKTSYQCLLLMDSSYASYALRVVHRSYSEIYMIHPPAVAQLVRNILADAC